MTDERVESEGYYEMLWDCPHCDTKGLFGKSQRHCPECGAPQDASTRYFPTPEQQTLVVGHVYEGADAHCPACTAPQSARAKNCAQCGSPMDGSQQVREVIAGIDASVAAAQAGARTVAASHGRRWWPILAALAALGALGFGIWFLFLRTQHGQVTITGHRWERTIAIEQLGDQSHEAWRDAVPAGASFPSCHRKQRTTRQVPDGEDCHTERKDKKDGTFEQVRKCSPKTRSEGVDDDWCAYTLREWAKVGEEKATGRGLAPAWPVVTLAGDPLPTLGARRQGHRGETLTLDFGPDDSCEVSDAIWRKYADGARAQVELRARSGGVVCDSL